MLHGDCRDALRTLPDASVDAVVTDPPYEIGFMGRGWDSSGVAYDTAVWRECLRVLKPGGHLLAFGGTRTWHRLVVAVEDAGFEIRDSITWLYASGFPKSLDVSKAIDKAAGAEREVVGVGQYAGRGRRTDNAVYGRATPSAGEVITAPATEAARQWRGWGTALKPATEPVVVARKPLAGTVAACVLAHGTGALNIDGCRVETAEALGRPYGGDNEVYGKYSMPRGTRTGDELTGRWPANVVLTHAPDCGPDDAAPCVDGCPVADLDAQSGVLKSGANPTRRGSDKFRDACGDFAGQAECTPARGADSGGASRFFPTFRYQAKAPSKERPKVDGVAHPTVKPLALIRWLIRLVTPPRGVVLDPFLGSGTAAEAAALEGFDFIGCELGAEWLPLADARLERLPDAPDVTRRRVRTVDELIAAAATPDALADLWRAFPDVFDEHLVALAGQRFAELRETLATDAPA